MRTIKEIICLLAGLFILGVAGGLEKGLISVGGAIIAWAVTALVVGIIILTGRRMKS